MNNDDEAKKPQPQLRPQTRARLPQYPLQPQPQINNEAQKPQPQPKPQPKNPPRRPPKPFNRNRLSEENKEKVYQLACQGIDSFIIAQELNVGKPLLMVRCRDQLQLGYDKAVEAGILKRHPLTIGPKAIEFTPEMQYQTEKLAGLGIPIRQIADILGVTESWLSNIGMDTIDLGRAKAHATVAEVLFNMASDEEHPAMTTFYLKTQCGWKEATQIEFPDEHGVPQQITGPTTIVNIEKMQVLIDKLNEVV